MYEKTFTVSDVEGRERLDHFLSRRMPGVSLFRLREAIRAGEITINGESRESGRRVRIGDRVDVRMAEEPVNAMLPEPIPIRVVYEDGAIVVVDKPAGMLAHPTSRVHSGTMLNAVAYHLNREVAEPGHYIRPKLVHRLDRATSGLLVISKTARAHNVLARAWNERKVEKRYVALVCGRFPEEFGLIDAPIGGARDRFPGFGVDEMGRPAQTRYRVIEHYGPFTLVELEPLTGRTNQLRIHAAHVGSPIAGEDLHGLPGVAAFSALHPTVRQPERLFLHASRLCFTHPESREWTTLECRLPPELTAYLDAAER
jgi:23S rRNA pseudouridine1911/1915/1917 synthase